ncbi:MAG: glycosyltransferase [Chitinophagaceae bacterium]
MEFAGQYFELCILIPCYNNIAGLKKSLKSIQYDQGKYLIIIVDDGSKEIINSESIGASDLSAPVHIIRLEMNQGITIALNTGLHWLKDSIKCRYIARLDCGDVCDATRFYKQIDFLGRNPNIMLIGSWCYFINQEKRIKFSYKTPVDHEAIERALYFRNVFIHPTIIVRRIVLEKIGLYPEEYPHAEDYAWFWKIANTMKTAMLPSFLVTCEFNVKGISYENRTEQLRSRMAIVRKFGHKFALRELAIIKIWFLMKIPYSIILKIKTLMSV